MEDPLVVILSGSPALVEDNLNQLIGRYRLVNFCFLEAGGAVTANAFLVSIKGPAIMPAHSGASSARGGRPF